MKLKPVEIGDFGSIHDCYGNVVRVVRKQGDYGEFLNIESGETHVHYDEKGDIVPTVKIKAWFKIPSDPVLIHELASMLDKAAISLKEKEEELATPDPVDMHMEM